MIVVVFLMACYEKYHYDEENKHTAPTTFQIQEYMVAW
jgi:hypothetical protein